MNSYAISNFSAILANVTRETVEKVAAENGRPVLEVITDLQAAAVTLTDSEATLEKLCAIKAELIEASRPARKVNTRPYLIARFQAGEAVDGRCGAILVYLFETAGAPFFRLVVDGGELPQHCRSTYATAKAAIQTAADLALTLIYDEVAEIEEVGDEVEADARAAALAAGLLDSVGMLEAAEHDDFCPTDDSADA